MFVIVENGALTEASIDRLQKWTEEQVQKGMNYSRFLLMEGETVEDGTPNPQSFRIRVMPLAQYQKDDQLFQKYDGNNREKVRQSFRLPPIFVGRTEDYTRATADTSRAVADEQVFAPERNKDTFAVNRFVLARWGARFHTFKLNNPNVTDDIQLITLMGMAERSGGMTPRRADRIIRDVFGEDIGPMPQGVPLDVPFSVTFAQAQSGLGSGGGAPSGDTARRVIDGMLDLRRRIEKELDDRFFLTE
jgi:capsid portal protein